MVDDASTATLGAMVQRIKSELGLDKDTVMIEAIRTAHGQLNTASDGDLKHQAPRILKIPSAPDRLE